MCREEAASDMDERHYRKIERERRRSSLAKGKERRSSKAGEEGKRGADIRKKQSSAKEMNGNKRDEHRNTRDTRGV